LRISLSHSSGSKKTVSKNGAVFIAFLRAIDVPKEVLFLPKLKPGTAHNMGMLGIAYLASMPVDGELVQQTTSRSQRLHPLIGSMPIDWD
jgi:hypothetical protein